MLGLVENTNKTSSNLRGSMDVRHKHVLLEEGPTFPRFSLDDRELMPEHEERVTWGQTCRC